MPKKNINTRIVGTPWFIRLGLYVIVAIVGLVLTVLGMANPDQVDGWLQQAGSLAAIVGGLFAAANTGPDSDNHPRSSEPRPATNEPVIVHDAPDELTRLRSQLGQE